MLDLIRYRWKITGRTVQSVILLGIVFYFGSLFTAMLPEEFQGVRRFVYTAALMGSIMLLLVIAEMKFLNTMYRIEKRMKAAEEQAKQDIEARELEQKLMLQERGMILSQMSANPYGEVAMQFENAEQGRRRT